jgi:uncharacterized repeat protein (TIGR02543 family)
MLARSLMPAAARRLLLISLFVFLGISFLARTSSPPVEAAGGSGPSIWLTQAEIDSLPMSGPGWDNVYSAAQENTSNPDFSDQSHDTDVNLMAKALVYARTGDTRYRNEAIDTIMASIDTEGGATALAVARNTTATVIAADLINLSDNPSEDAQFRAWIDQLRTTDLSGRTLISTHEGRPNNWGTHAGSSRIAIDLYLGDTADLAEAARIFEGYLGNRDVYAGFKYGDDLSWQCDPDKPVGVNPVGCTIDGHPVDGVVPDDQRRGGNFQWPPPQENYAWGALQGAVAQAYMLSRVGYPAWDWEDQAIRRAVVWLHDYADFPARGDDEWQPWMVNWAYGTDFPAPSPAGAGKLVGWTDWTHADAGPPSTNQHVLTVNIGGSGTVDLNPPGGVYNDGTVVTLEARPGPGYMFAGWGGDLGGTANPESLRMSRDRSVTATFVQDSPTQQYTLDVTITGNGTINLNPPGGLYDEGTQVTLQATADPGWIFAGWGGELSGSASPVTVLMDADKNVSATFIQPSTGGGAVKYEETVSGGSSDSGSVSTSTSLKGVAGHLYIAAISTKAYRDVVAVSGMGLSWMEFQAQCSGRNATGMEIWYAIGAPNGDGVVTALLGGSVPREAVISVSRYSGVDSGVPIGAFTSANTNGYDGACSNGSDTDSYSVNLSAASNNAVIYSAVAIRGRSHEPGAGFTELVEMSGVAGIAVQDKQMSAPASVNADGSFYDRTVDWAVIALEIRAGDSSGSTKHSLSVNTSGSGSVSLNPAGGVYDDGDVVTLEAVPAPGWRFTGWSGHLSGTTNPTTLTMGGNRSVTATFVEDSGGGGGGTVTHEETKTGGSSNTGSVSTFFPLTAAEGHLYVAAISTRMYRATPIEVVSIGGLSLDWQRFETQCGGRNTTGIEIWYALGRSGSDGIVTANLSGNVLNAVIAVSRYSGVDTDNPIGAIVTANTNGTGDDTCVDGIDSASYSANLTTGAGESVVYSAVAMRRRSHTPGAGFTEQAEASQGSGGRTAGIAVQDRSADPFSSVTVNGSFDKDVDWALIAFEIRPGSG